MIRTTITMDEALTRELDAYIARSGAFNRSEAIRDLVRRGLQTVPVEDDGLPCIGVVSCAVDQTIAGLTRRLREARLDRHDQILFTASVPVDHHSTIDLTVMRGTVGRVNDYAQAMFLERGVRHGAIGLTPIEEEVQRHAHGDGEPHDHVHIRVQESF